MPGALKPRLLEAVEVGAAANAGGAAGGTSPRATTFTPRATTMSLAGSPTGNAVGAVAGNTGNGSTATWPLDSPRMVAAMKVTGIESADVELPMTLGDEGTSSTASLALQKAAQRKQELMEFKRGQLLRELQETADTLDDEAVEQILSASSAEGSQTLDNRSVFRSEKEKIDKKTAHLKSQFQKEIDKALERKKEEDRITQEREAWVRRLREENEKDSEKMLKRQEEKAKRDLDMEQKLQAVTKAEREKRRDMLKRVAESEERVCRQLEERNNELAAAQEARRQKMADALQRNMDHRQADAEEKMRRQREAVDRSRERDERLQQRLVEEKNRAASQRAKFSDKLCEVQDALNKAQERRVRSFEESLSRFDKARKHNEEQLAAVVGRARATRQKEEDRANQHRRDERKKQRENLVKMKVELEERHTRAEACRNRLFEDTILPNREMRAYLKELTEKNKERLARSDEWAREQVFARIISNRAKVDSQQKQKKQVLDYRTIALRDEMKGRRQLHELRTIMRDAPLKEINKRMKELDLPLLKEELAKKGEENQGTQ